MHRRDPNPPRRLLRPLLAAACLWLSPAPSFAQGAGAAGAPPPPPQEQEARQNPALAPFRQVLERFGTIAPHPRYGEVWLPGVVPEGWSPYPPCRWVFDRQQNLWAYQDPTEWGSIVHHYGRWVLDQQSGWMWIADGNAGPGWVYWKTEGGNVSWAALGPETDGQSVPTDGWHVQDQPTFTAGCRASAPPPPVAAAGPRPAAMPMPVPVPVPMPAPPPVYVAPAYPVAPPVVVVPGPRPLPPPVVIVARPPIFVPDGHCRRFPGSPACRPRPNGPGAGPGPHPGPGGGKGAGSVPGPMPTPTPQGGPKPGAPQTSQQRKACELNPASPACRGQVAGTGKPQIQPRVAALPQRPKPFVSPYMRPRPTRAVYGARPNGYRPAVRVSGGYRPAYRPAVQARPVAMSRPAMRPQGGGGGHRGGGGGGRPRRH